jgi:hypothetical protein
MTVIQELISEFEEIKKTKCKTLQEVIFFNGVLSIIEGKYLKKEQYNNKYSEEEVLVKLYECLGHFAQKHNIIINGNEIDQWFEQFKKK